MEFVNKLFLIMEASSLQFFKNFCQSRGIQHILTAPYYPQSNGEAERFVQTFKTAIMKSKLGGEKMKPSLRNFLARYRSYSSLYNRHSSM